MASRHSSHHTVIYHRSITQKLLTGMWLASMILALIMVIYAFRDSPTEWDDSSSAVTPEDGDGAKTGAAARGRKVMVKVEPFQPISERLVKAFHESHRPKDSGKFVQDSVYSRQIKLHHSDYQPYDVPTTRHSDLEKSHPESVPSIHKQSDSKKPTARSSHGHSDMDKNVTVAETLKTVNRKLIDLAKSHNNGINDKEELKAMFEKRNEARLDRVNWACAKFGAYWQKYRPQAEFYHSPDHQLLYCKVAKGGCTFWEQLYSFILRPESMKREDYTTLYEIPRWRIHFDRNITPPALHWSKASGIPQEKLTRFMFTRDPFSRIWSAYIDKIWLPDFWYWMRIKNHKTTTYTDRCLYDVTFTDFVEYISLRSNNNKHWAPIHQSCNPCMFKPHILGNMSTFAEDARQILGKGNLEFVLSQYNYEMRVQNELKMLVQYNYERLHNKSRLYNFCEFTNRDMAYRLWRTFQINGYISKSIPFPHDLKEFEEKPVLDAILKTVSERPLRREESSVQRRFFLRKAYQSVPRHVINKMLIRFEPDFVLFGFDRYPDFLLKSDEAPKPLDLLSG